MNLEKEQRLMRERNSKPISKPIRNATKISPWATKTPLDFEIMNIKTAITEAQKHDCTRHGVAKLKKRLRLLEATREIDQQLR